MLKLIRLIGFDTMETNRDRLLAKWVRVFNKYAKLYHTNRLFIMCVARTKFRPPDTIYYRIIAAKLDDGYEFFMPQKW